MRSSRLPVLAVLSVVGCLIFAVSPGRGQELCFQPAVNYPAGATPVSVFAADLDGDGDADLAVAIEGSDNVSVLKNNGDGTFAAPMNYAAGSWPLSVFAADLDGDNDADLAVANLYSDNVSVLKNNGDGTFAAAVNYAAGDGSYSVFATDLDGDNDADLAVANEWSDNVSVLKNNGDGTFAAAVNYAVGYRPSSVFAADLDGDNDADLAVANRGSDNVSVLKNNGGGTYAAAVNYAAGDGPHSVFAADLDGDNDADLAVANGWSDNVSVLKNNGDGTFAAAVYYAAGYSPLSVFAADLDGDHDADLAVANYSYSGTVSVLKNNGDGTLAAAMNYAAGDRPQSVFAADLDGDNDADLAVVNAYSDNVSVLINCAPPCPCPCHGDPVCDGLLNIIDCVVVADVLMGRTPPTTDPGCAYERTDVSCNGTTDLLDLIKFINVVFYAGDPATQFCHPNPQPCRDTLDPGSCNPGIPTPFNTVVVESKQVTPGATGVQVGVYVQNNVALNGMIIPLEIREVTPGAYVKTAFTCQVTGRLAGSGITEYGGTRLYRDPDTANACSGPVSETYRTPGSATGTYFTSPSALMWSGVNSSQPCLGVGSDGVPGSGTPSVMLTFDVTTTSGEFEIDTCCVMPANHLAFAVCGTHECLLPSFTKGVIRIGNPPTLSCNLSYTDPYLLACPRGDIPFVIHLKGTNNLPWVGDHSIYLDFSSCTSGEFLPQPGVYPNWPRVYVASPSDDSGRVFVSIAAGGNCADCEVSVYADCGLIGTVPVRSVDVDGDAWVLPFDSDPALGNCRDVNADGVVDNADLVRLAAHCCDHRYPTGSCDWLSQSIETVPTAGFDAGDPIRVRYIVDNNPSGGTCLIDSVVFYQSEMTVTPTWEWVQSRMVGVVLPRAASYADSFTYVVPSYGNMCLRTLLYSSCCSEPQEAKRCFSQTRQCPPGTVCYQFVALKLAQADQIREVPFVPPGWTYYVEPHLPDTAFYVICTDAQTPIGTTGSVMVFYHTASGWGHFDFQVRQDWRNGDLCGGPNGQVDCIVNLQDVGCLVNLVFRGSIPPIPNPKEHGDVNCDGIYNVVDVVKLVDYVFRGGPPPPDCGAGPAMH